MSQMRDQNYFEKKGLIFSHPIVMSNQIPRSITSNPVQHPFLMIKQSQKILHKQETFGVNDKINVQIKSETKIVEVENTQSIETLMQKAVQYEKELEQRQLQIAKLTSDYEKQRMQAFELEQKLVLLNEENMRFRESLSLGKKISEKSQNQDIIHQQQLLQLQSEQENKQKLYQSQYEIQILNDKLIQAEEQVKKCQQQIQSLSSNQNTESILVQSKEKNNQIEKEKIVFRDELEKKNKENQDMLTNLSSKVRHLEFENTSLKENASQAQIVNGNKIAQLMNQVQFQLEQIKILEQAKAQQDLFNLQNSRISNSSVFQLQQDNEKLICEKVILQNEIQTLQNQFKKLQQNIEEYQCERNGLMKQNENLIIYLQEKSAAYDNLNQIYNESLKRNESQIENILQQQSVEIQKLVDHHKQEMIQIQYRMTSSQEQKQLIMQKIDHLQEHLTNSNKQGLSLDFQEQILKTYQQLINALGSRDNYQQSNLINQNPQQVEILNNLIEENKNLVLLLEDKQKEIERLQNLCDALQDEINMIKQQNQCEDIVKRQRKILHSDNDTTQDINASPIRPQIFEQDHIIRSSQGDQLTQSQIIYDLKKQIQEFDDKLSLEIENRKTVENENIKLRLSIQRYEMMGGIQNKENPFQGKNENQINSKETFNQQEDNSELFEVSRYLQEEVDRLKGLLDVQKVEFEQQINTLKEQIVMTESFSIINNNIISPQLKYQKPIITQDIANQCIYEEQNEQSSSGQSNQTGSIPVMRLDDEGNPKSVLKVYKTQEEFQKNDLQVSDQKLCFSFQDQISHLNGQIRQAENELKQYKEKIFKQEQLIQEQNNIIEKNNLLIGQFQENLKESQYEMQSSGVKNKELEQSVINYQMQLQTYVGQMHKNIEQLNQYENIIKILENEIQEKNAVILQNQQIISNLNIQINSLSQQLSSSQDADNVKRAKHQNTQYETTIELNNIINQLKKDIDQKIVQINKLSYDIQVSSGQNITYLNEIAALKEQSKQLIIILTSSQQSNENILRYINNHQLQDIYGNEVLQELLKFSSNIYNLQVEIQQAKGQYQSQIELYLSLQGEYQQLSDSYNTLMQQNQQKISGLEQLNLQLQAQNDEQLEEIQKLTDHVDQIQNKMNEDRIKIEELEKKAQNLIYLEQAQNNIIEQQSQKDMQLQEQCENQLNIIQQLKDQLQLSNSIQPQQNQNRISQNIKDSQAQSQSIYKSQEQQQDIKESQKLKQNLQESLKYQQNIQDSQQKQQNNQYCNQHAFKINELQQLIFNLEQKLQISEDNRNQGQLIMEETTDLIDNLNNQIKIYKDQIEQQQEFIISEGNKYENLQNEHQQNANNLKVTINTQNQLIQHLESQVQTKQLEINPLQIAVEQIQQILQTKAKELEKCQNLISNLQSQEKSSYEIIKQQEVFLLEFQKIKKQHQLEKEQNQKVIFSLQHSLDKAQKEVAIQDQNNKSINVKYQEAQQQIESLKSSINSQVKLNTDLQASLNQVRSRENSQVQNEERIKTINDGKISSSLQLEDNQNPTQQNQNEENKDYKKQYEELQQILEDQNYLDTLNKYAQQEIQLTREVDDLKEQNNKLQQEQQYASNQINTLNMTINSIKNDFALKNQRLQEIFDSNTKDKQEQDILIIQLREQTKDLNKRIEEHENKAILMVTENQRLSLIRMELLKQLDSKVKDIPEQEGSYIHTLEKTLEECQRQKQDIFEQLNILKLQNKQCHSEQEKVQIEKQNLKQQLERLQYQQNLSMHNVNQKQAYIEKLEQQINQQNNANSQNLQQIHNLYQRKINELKCNTQLNNHTITNSNILNDDSKQLSFLNSISFQEVQELKKEKLNKDHQFNCLLVNFEDQKRQLITLSNQKDMLTSEIMLLKELNQQYIFQLNQHTHKSIGHMLTDNQQIQQKQMAQISQNLDKLQNANDLLIKENESLRNQYNIANQKLANTFNLINQNKEYICSCRGSNRLQVSVVEGELEISDLKDYFGQINQNNNANISLQPSQFNTKKYNLKINQCAKSFENSPSTSKDQNNSYLQPQQDNSIPSDQRKLEDIQNISISHSHNSTQSEKKRTSSFMNPKDIRKSITDSTIKQQKCEENSDKNILLQYTTENQH